MRKPSSTRKDQAMADGHHVYCPTCFAAPGEQCRSAFWIRGDNQVVAVMCPTHDARWVSGDRHALYQSEAERLLAAALIAFRGH